MLYTVRVLALILPLSPIKTAVFITLVGIREYLSFRYSLI